MSSGAEWAPEGIDTRRANVARVYDYLLGGTHNFLADQDVARALLAVEPAARAMARANRAFASRAVRFLAAVGIRQFLDIGAGLPTAGNVHEVARAAAPGAKVVLADADEVAVAHGRAMLDGDAGTAIVEGDVREPAGILSHPDTRRLIDFSQPIGLLLTAVLHFIAPADQPHRIVSELAGALAPGSYLVISCATGEGKPELAAAIGKVYNRNVTRSGHGHPAADVARFFDGLELVEPGLVSVPYWRPDPPGPPADADQIWGFLAGVARKPGR